MNILYILRHNPWDIGGGCYACRCYLEAFTAVFSDAEFDVCVCEEYKAPSDSPLGGVNVRFVKVAQRSRLEKALSPVTGLLHRFDCTARRMLKAKRYDYCIFDHNSIAGPLVRLCQQLRVKTIVINHNCEAEYYRDNYDWLHKTLFLRHVKKAERQSYLGCDYNIFLTEEDKALFEEQYGKSSTRSVVTGCFEAPSNLPPRGRLSSLPMGEELGLTGERLRLRLVISGTIGNVQNMDGIQYFLHELLECVPKEAEVVIAGKNPPEGLKAQIEGLNREGHYAQTTLIPNPEDISEIVGSCDIFVCPTRLGGGLKLRVMDGLRAGLPVIAHRVSARGYSAFALHGYLWAFDGKKTFEDALREIVGKVYGNELNRTVIQNFADRQFSFEGKVEMLKDIFRC